MIDINIDDFFHDISITLLSLYQQFPRKISLYIEDISGPDDMDEFGLHSNRYLSAIGAVTWLHEEGYIRYSNITHQESVEDCTLTQKAFVKLIRPTFEAGTKSITNSIEKHQNTLAQRLHNALKEQSSISQRSLLEEYLLKP
jgi:hypothetical protein